MLQDNATWFPLTIAYWRLCIRFLGGTRFLVSYISIRRFQATYEKAHFLLFLHSQSNLKIISN